MDATAAGQQNRRFTCTTGPGGLGVSAPQDGFRTVGDDIASSPVELRHARSRPRRVARPSRAAAGRGRRPLAVPAAHRTGLIAGPLRAAPEPVGR